VENAKKTFLDEDYNRESSGFAEVQIGCSALAGGLNSRPIPLFFWGHPKPRCFSLLIQVQDMICRDITADLSAIWMHYLQAREAMD